MTTNDQRPNIIVIVMDAVRAENLSLLGYHQPTTPHLERHADKLAWYPNCISAATWTLPSTTGLFTGTYPSTHRLVIDGDRLHPRFTTLAEWLVSRGYFTAKVTGQVPYVSDFTGLDRGFGYSFEPSVGWMRKHWRAMRRKRAAANASPEKSKEGVDLGLDLKTEAQMNARAGFKWRARFWATGFYDSGAAACFNHVRDLWSTHTDDPKFIYMHLQETHAEYRPPHRYRRKFIDPALRGHDLASINQRPNPHAVGLVNMTEEDYAILTGLYDGCIAYLDEQIGALLDHLSTRPDFDNTMIVVTADHGDCIGRHGVLGHQFVCYDELVRIPWVVKWPRSVGEGENFQGEQDALVQNIDLVPTIAQMFNERTPSENEGVASMLDPNARDLAVCELLKPFGRSAINQGLHTMAPHYFRRVLALRSKTHKLIRHSNNTPDEFYNLTTDSLETHSLLDNTQSNELADDADMTEIDHSEFERLKSEMITNYEPRWREAGEEIHDRLFGENAADIAPEVEDRLRALGYLD